MDERTSTRIRPPEVSFCVNFSMPCESFESKAPDGISREKTLLQSGQPRHIAHPTPSTLFIFRTSDERPHDFRLHTIQNMAQKGWVGVDGVGEQKEQRNNGIVGFVVYTLYFFYSLKNKTKRWANMRVILYIMESEQSDFAKHPSTRECNRAGPSFFYRHNAARLPRPELLVF